jgi:hypothetical protein
MTNNMYQLYSTSMNNYVRSNKVRVNTRLGIKQTCVVHTNKRNENVYVYSIIVCPIINDVDVAVRWVQI